MIVRLTRAAEADLEAIGDWIAERNPARAISFVGEIRQATTLIGDFPHAGPARSTWGEGVRVKFFKTYVIAYRIRGDHVEILRIVHGARDLARLFADEPLD